MLAHSLAGDEGGTFVTTDELCFFASKRVQRVKLPNVVKLILRNKEDRSLIIAFDTDHSPTIAVLSPNEGSRVFPILKTQWRKVRPRAAAPIAAPARALSFAEAPVKDLGAPHPHGWARAAQAEARRRNYARAVQLQYQHLEKAQDGRYDLACYLSRRGAPTDALYWLQELRCSRVSTISGPSRTRI